MTRQETIDNIIPTSTYVGSAVRKMINEISDIRVPPAHFKKGDIIKVYVPSQKPRPAVIIRVREEYVVSIPLTTDENVHCMTESNSRFTRESCFCNSYIVTPIETAKENFLGVYDNTKSLNTAIKELRLFIAKNI